MKQTCRTSKGQEQMCGVLAKQALERIVKGQDVTCKGDKRDRYKRLLYQRALIRTHTPIDAFRWT